LARVKELNVVRKKGKPGSVKIGLVYPSVYEVAIASLAYQMIYYYVNSLDDFIGERFNLATLTGEEPKPLSLESDTPLEKFEIALFSVHYEPDYVNIVRLLMAAGIDPRKEIKERPLIIIGGLPLLGNPEPLANIADVLVIGEIEPTIPYMLHKYLEHRDDKSAFLDSLNPERGFYVPKNEPDEVLVVRADELSPQFHPIAQLQPIKEGSVWERGTMIEAMRGCPHRCAFCLEASVMGPKRDRPLAQIVKIASEGAKLNMSNKAILYALSFFDHSKADDILKRLHDIGLKTSVPSLRLETLDEDRLEMISLGGQKTLTLAPETASKEISISIGKPLIKERLLEVALAAKKAGIKSLKLYFMVGLPGETMEDVKTIPKLIRRLSEFSGFKGERELKVNITPFIPKPRTPLERARMEDVNTLRKKIELIRRELRGLAEARSYDPRWALVQALLSRGDRGISTLLVRWAMHGGGLGGLRRALRELGIRADPNESIKEEVPWAKIRDVQMTCLKNSH